MGIHNCRKTTFEERPTLLRTFLLFLSLGALLCCILVPVLLQNLRGSPRIFLVLQQISAVLFVVFSFIPMEINVSTLVELHSKPWGSEDPFPNSVLTQNICNFFAAFFLSQHFVFSILQSFNYHEMISNPLHFEEYAKVKKVLRRVMAMSLVSVVLCVDYLIDCVISEKSVSQALHIVRLAKYPIVKVLYTATLIFVAYKIRLSLKQSNSIRGSTTLSSLFIAVCVVPLVNNVLFLGVEVPNAVIPFLFSREDNLHAAFCTSGIGHFVRHIQMPLTISVFAMGSLMQCAAFLAGFPKLRENVFVKLWKKIRGGTGDDS